MFLSGLNSLSLEDQDEEDEDKEEDEDDEEDDSGTDDDSSAWMTVNDSMED